METLHVHPNVKVKELWTYAKVLPGMQLPEGKVKVQKKTVAGVGNWARITNTKELVNGSTFEYCFAGQQG